MEFLTDATDGRMIGFVSRADEPESILIHVHGYGGDAYSNRFVRSLHASMPSMGVSFVSCVLKTSGFLGERYLDGDVSYVGSAVVDPEVAVGEVLDLVESFSQESQVVLQGHSFGTNVVRVCLEQSPRLAGAVFIAPADSAALQKEFEAAWSSGHPGPQHGRISWEHFGIRLGDIAYPIPIDPDLFATLRKGRVFNAWSPPSLDPLRDLPCLLVQGDNDAISAFGTTADLLGLCRSLNRAEVRLIEGAGHSFIDREERLVAAVAAWLRDYGLARERMSAA